MPTIAERIAGAKSWVDSLYQTDGYYGYVKEYPGFPVGIVVNYEARLAGDWRKQWWWLWWMAVSKLTRYFVTPIYDVSTLGMEDGWDADYNEPMLTVWRQYYTDGSTRYTVRFERYDGTQAVDVYVGDTRLWTNVRYTAPGTTYTIVKSGFRGLPSNRYTVRHAARLGQFLYQIWGDTTKATALGRLRSNFGFTYDIYDPLFGVSSEQAMNFMFTTQAYADTPDVVARLPRGLIPHRYPYASKVTVNAVTRGAYIFQSYKDPLLRMLQAIHCLNKYHDPYVQYATLGGGPISQVPGEVMIVTPVSIAEECGGIPGGKWNGIGISHPQDASVASGVRTAAFLALTTLLGYGYGVQSMKGWTNMKGCADAVYNILTKDYAPQAGFFPLSPGWITTSGNNDPNANGALLRPPYHGSFYNLWTDYGNRVAACDKDTSLLNNLIDMFNMPPEDAGPIPANTESTITMLQALRIYAHCALKVDVPTGSLLPYCPVPVVPVAPAPPPAGGGGGGGGYHYYYVSPPRIY